MLTVNLDGQIFSKIAHPELINKLADDAGVDVSRLEIDVDQLAAFEADVKRMKIRAEIEPVAGDTLSLLGTTSDATGLLLDLVIRMATAMSTSNDPNLFGVGVTVLDDLAPLVSGIQAGTVKLPHMVKTIPAVVADIGERGTAVTEVFEANAAG